jgi:hypothetical protein
MRTPDAQEIETASTSDPNAGRRGNDEAPDQMAGGFVLTVSVVTPVVHEDDHASIRTAAQLLPSTSFPNEPRWLPLVVRAVVRVVLALRGARLVIVVEWSEHQTGFCGERCGSSVVGG